MDEWEGDEIRRRSSEGKKREVQWDREERRQVMVDGSLVCPSYHQPSFIPSLPSKHTHNQVS
jgi:hypothetical protein